ncbi:MAG: hypothetical protein PUP92_36410 [Rhizonema sp. PD38]|nr:hypothetical protein [Rhizonema sp. PD38]
MQPNGWKNIWCWILLAFSSSNLCCTRVDAAWAQNPNRWSRKDEFVLIITYPVIAHITDQPFQKLGPQKKRNVLSRTKDTRIVLYANSLKPSLYSQILPPPNQTSQAQNSNPQRNDPPPLEGPINDFPKPSPTEVEQRLNPLNLNYTQRIERLRQLLQEKKQPSSESNSNTELGDFVLEPLPLNQVPVPPSKPPIAKSKSKPVGYLLGHVGYFRTNNIFSSVPSREDGLILAGLTLASAPLPLNSKTYLIGSIDANQIYYTNQSKYDYNQLRFNLDIYQQLTSRMYGDIGWTNQQLFYQRSNFKNYHSGDRFLNENSFRLSLGRKDPFTSKLSLNSFYELRLSFTDPPSGIDSRNRVINSLWLSLNYELQKPLQVGLDYQFGLSNFTQRRREDQSHQIFGHLTYGISDYSNLSLQGGVTLGNSTERNINFDGWFFTLNYVLQLGRF